MNNGNLYSVLFESASDAIFLMRRDQLVDCNPSALTLLGCTRESAIGQPMAAFLADPQPDGTSSTQVVENAVDAALTGKNQRAKWVYQHTDQKITFQAWGMLCKASIDDDMLLLQVPQIQQVYNGNNHTTAPSQADNELDRFFSTASALMAVTTKTHRFKRANPAWKQLLGHTQTELRKLKHFFDLVHPDDREAAKATLNQQLAAEAEQITLETRYQSQDGSYKWLLWNITPAKENQLYCVVSDITIQKQAQQQAQRETPRPEPSQPEAPAQLTAPALPPPDVSPENWRGMQKLRRQIAKGYVFDLDQLQPVQSKKETGLLGHITDSEVPGNIEITNPDATIPITIGGTAIGKLGVQSDTGEALSDEDQSLLDAIAVQVAGALERAQLLDQTQQRAAELQRAAIESDRLRHETEERMQELRNLQRLMSREGWQEYHATQQETLQGYLFDQSAVRPMEPREMAKPRKPGSSDEADSLVTPIAVSGEIIGTLGIQADPDNPLSEAEQELLDSISVQVASALERARLLTQSRQRAVELQLAAQETEERMQELRNLQRLMSREGWQEYQASQTHATQGYLFDQAAVRPVAPNKLQAQQKDTTTTMTTPIAVSGEIIGALGIQADENNPLTEAEQELLDSISVQVASAMERARLLTQSRKSASELQTVARVSAAASTILDKEALLQEVVDLTRDNFGLYHAHIYLYDVDTDALALAAGAGKTGRKMRDEGRVIPVSHKQSIVAQAARSREGVISNDVRNNPIFLPHPLLPKTRSEMAIPLIVGDQLLGVYDVQADQLNRFSDEDMRIQTTLASQVAIALRNAQLYVEQAETVEQLRELDQLKSSFLANMSHELRTPLNSILGFTDVLLEELDGPLTDLMRTDLEVVYKNGQHLLNLINDVLDMAKIEAGGMSLAYERFDILETLTEVADVVSPMARTKNIELRVTNDIMTPVFIDGDQIRLRQVIINIVNNAVKFTDEGGVYMSADIQEDTNTVLLAIRDTGLGIPLDKQDLIFEEFGQVDTSTTRKVGGTGLGLPITKHLVNMHGGKIWVESSGVEGEGATFYIEMPAEHIPEKAEEAEIIN